MKNKWIDSIASIAIIMFLFIFLSYIIQSNLDFFKKYLDFGFFGMLVFVVILVLSIVVAPFGALPLFPIASNLWGWATTGALGVIGWTLGSVIAFALARKYGVDLVKKVLPIKKIYSFEGKISEEHLFWTVVFLTMVVAVDGVSYIFGLFSKIKLRDYALATIIGLIPFSFAIAYLGGISFYYTIDFFLMTLVIFTAGWFLLNLIKKMPKNFASPCQERGVFMQNFLPSAPAFSVSQKTLEFSVPKNPRRIFLVSNRPVARPRGINDLKIKRRKS